MATMGLLDLVRIGQQPAFKLLVGDQTYQDVPVDVRLRGSATTGSPSVMRSTGGTGCVPAGAGRRERW